VERADFDGKINRDALSSADQPAGSSPRSLVVEQILHSSTGLDTNRADEIIP